MKGIICQWKDDRGFGFIQPQDGSEKLFFHVSVIKTDGRRPEVGDKVTYEVARDAQRRLNAIGVVIEGVSRSSSASLKARFSCIEPPKKNALDYITILVAVASLGAAGFEFLTTERIEIAVLFGLPSVIAFFVLNRQKKPKEKSFQCSRCRKIAEHDLRTIRAWNKGFIKLYCGACHQRWLVDKPKPERSLEHKPTPERILTQGRGGGCLGALILLFIMPTLCGVGLYQWLM